MADISIVFKGALGTSTESAELEVFANTQNKITLTLKDETSNFYPTIIQLTKPTAIKLHRELKKQISYLKSEEVDNG